MVRDRSESAMLSPEELAAVKRIGRKRLGQDGCPEDRQPRENPLTAGKPDDAVPENEQAGFIDEMRGM